jgi:(p)ppGpp synthase/HD superfamily hydrolase
MTNAPQNDLVLRAIRIAEYAHRNRPQGPHYRKAPKGKDRPYYFVHLAEVAWMLSDSGCSHEVVAAGYLHDIIGDCQYTGDQLEKEIGDRRVRDLVEWVTEVDRVGPDGKKLPWEVRITRTTLRTSGRPLLRP